MITLLNTPQLVTDNVLYRINKLLEHIQFLKSKYPEDREAHKHFNWIIKELNIIRNFVLYNPRFGWSEIQKEMDRLFRLDNSLTGFQLNIDFVDTDKPKRALIERNFSKS